jgi:hypothetical protein
MFLDPFRTGALSKKACFAAKAARCPVVPRVGPARNTRALGPFRNLRIAAAPMGQRGAWPRLQSAAQPHCCLAHLCVPGFLDRKCRALSVHFVSRAAHPDPCLLAGFQTSHSPGPTAREQGGTYVRSLAAYTRTDRAKGAVLRTPTLSTPSDEPDTPAARVYTVAPRATHSPSSHCTHHRDRIPRPGRPADDLPDDPSSSRCAWHEPANKMGWAMAPTTKGLLSALLLAASAVTAQQAKLQVDLDSPGESGRRCFR